MKASGPTTLHRRATGPQEEEGSVNSVSGIKPPVNVVLSEWRERLSSPTEQDWQDMTGLAGDWSTCAAGEAYGCTHGGAGGRGPLMNWVYAVGVGRLGEDFYETVLREDREKALAILEQIEAKVNASIGQRS